MGQTFYRHLPGNFESNLNNIAIYVEATYGHYMGMTLKARKEAVIPHLECPKYNVTDSNKYIWYLECKSYITQREKLKQLPKCLLPLLIGQYNNTMKSKL